MDRSDQILIEETLGGRLESFDELMRRHERLAYKVALLHGGSAEDALDICQNAFLKAYRSLGSFRQESSFKTWLLRIVYNEGASWLRGQRRFAGHEALDQSADRASEEPGQEAGLLSLERRGLLVRRMGQLNPRHRMAVTLRYFRQMPLREIAAVLECSEGHVKNMLFRSIRMLRRSMAGSGIEEQA